MRAVACALSLSLIAACRGGKDSPTQPPPTNRVASVTRADSSVLQFTGTKVRIGGLFDVRDASGNTIPDAIIHCVTPSGFTFTGDSLIAPTSEERGKLRCGATTVPYFFASSPAGERSAYATDPTDSLTVTAGIDLRAHAFTAQWSCGSPSISWPGVGVVDSVQFIGRIANVSYPGDASYIINRDGIAQLLWRGKRSFWKGGAIVHVDADSVESPYATVWLQAPDTLELIHPTWSGGPQPMVKPPGATLRYTGRSWCPGTSGDFPYMTPTIMEERTS